MWNFQRHQESQLRRPRTQLAATRRGRSLRPRLEGLEDRTVLSTLTVLNAMDKGAGSLRDTISKARDGDTIVFDSGLSNRTITLTSDQLTINKSLDIEGPGASLLAISGNDNNRVFDINEGLTVTIAGLTITHGRSVGNDGGGGIRNVGSTLTLANDVLSNNVARGGAESARGGAIADLHGGALMVTDSTFVGNRADGSEHSRKTEGGAIFTSGAPFYAPVVTLVRCAFIANQAIGGNGLVVSPQAAGTPEVGLANGGAIHSGAEDGASTLTVEDSTFVGNQAIAGSGGSVAKGVSVYFVDGAQGGGISNDPGGVLVVNGCRFSSNQAIGGSNSTGTAGTQQAAVGYGVGGGLINEGTATITNSTFDHNEALGGSFNGGASGSFRFGRGGGGGIFNALFFEPVTLTVSNCTFTDNRAVGGAGNAGGPLSGAGTGGGLANQNGATATVTGSTFTGNQAIGGAGAAGGQGRDGLGGGIGNVVGSTLTVIDCTLTGNQAIGGAGGNGGNGGNGFGGGLFNDGVSAAGTPATLRVTGSTVTANHAIGGAAGAGGSVGLGKGGGIYLTDGGVACLDMPTRTHVIANQASTDHDDIFGVFTICP